MIHGTLRLFYNNIKRHGKLDSGTEERLDEILKFKGNKVKGYSINVTESCDDDKGLNLIGNVDVREASTSDVDFFQDNVKSTQEVFPDKTEAAHTDGAYHSPGNQSFCADNDIDLHLGGRIE